VAANTGRLRIEFFGKDRTLGRSFKDAWKHADSFDKKMKLLGTRMQTMGRTMTMGVTLPVVAGLAAATKAAMDDERSQRVLAEQIRNAVDATDEEIASVERFIDMQARATGVADDELRPAFAKLVTATGDVTRAQELMSIAQDTAAGTGRGLDGVITAMMKGQNGQVDLFGRMGIATKDAEGKTLSFDEVLVNLKDKFDGLAETKADPFDKLKVALGELGETAGEFLVPVLQFIADKLTAVAEWLQNLSPFWRKAAIAVALVAAAAGPLLWVLGSIVTVAPAVAAAFTFMFGPVGLTIAAVAALVAGLVILYKKNETFRNLVDSVWNVIKEAVRQVGKVVGWVIDKLGDMWGWVKSHKEPITKALKAAFWPISLAIGWAKTWIEVGGRVYGWVKEHWSGIARFLDKAFGPIDEAVTAALKLLGLLGEIENKSSKGGRGGGATGGGGGGTGGGGGGSGAYGAAVFAPASGEPWTLHGRETVVAHKDPTIGLADLAKSGIIGTGGGSTVVNVYLDSEPIAARVEVRQAKRARVNARTKGLALA
jgi:uncharacterized membrane protein YgcG